MKARWAQRENHSQILGIHRFTKKMLHKAYEKHEHGFVLLKRWDNLNVD